MLYITNVIIILR